MRIAIKPYQICYPNPLILKEGDFVTVIKSEPDTSEWFGWYFCTDSNGKEGWISSDFMKIENDQGLITRDYTAQELKAAEGQKFEVLDESCGWYWSSTEEGKTGWLPKNIF